LTVALNSMAGRFITVSYYQGDMETCKKYYSSVLIGNLAIIAMLIVPSALCVGNLERMVVVETANIAHLKYLFAFMFANFFVLQIVSVLNTACYVTNTQYLQNSVNMFRTVLNAALLLIVFSVFTPKIYLLCHPCQLSADPPDAPRVCMDQKKNAEGIDLFIQESGCAGAGPFDRLRHMEHRQSRRESADDGF